MKEKFVLIDGLCLLYRSFYAIKNMKNQNGKNIAGIYGFIREVLSIIRKLSPKYLAVALDTGKKTWRHDLSESYKANRKKTPEELSHQFQWIRDLCLVCGFGIYEGDGYEADDYIASCVSSYKSKVEFWIVTYDKDLYQLVDDSVYIYHPFVGVKIGTQEVLSKYNILPSQLGDFLALTGDTIDGVQGVKGIGPKTASQWLNQYYDLNGIIENINFLQPKVRRGILEANLDKLNKAKELISLYKSLDVGYIEDKKLKKICSKQFCKIGNFLKEMGLQSLIFDLEQALSLIPLL